MLQYDLNGLVSWSYDWDLNFNPSKCDVLKISWKRNSAFRNYTIEANALSETNSVKDLGVVISSTLSWHSHVISTVAKCNKILGFLRRNTPNSLHGNWSAPCSLLVFGTLNLRPCVTEAKFGPLSQALAIYFCLNVFSVVQVNTFLHLVERVSQIFRTEIGW